MTIQESGISSKAHHQYTKCRWRSRRDNRVMSLITASAHGHPIECHCSDNNLPSSDETNRCARSIQVGGPPFRIDDRLSKNRSGRLTTMLLYQHVGAIAMRGAGTCPVIPKVA